MAPFFFFLFFFFFNDIYSTFISFHFLHALFAIDELQQLPMRQSAFTPYQRLWCKSFSPLADYIVISSAVNNIKGDLNH